LIYSAHGVSDAVENTAKIKDCTVIDATCPLVKKVHREAIKYDDEGYQIILIGHAQHPEVEGTSGKVRQNVVLIENTKQAAEFTPQNPEKLAIITQTTLSLDDTKEIVGILTKRFPSIQVKNDICYATQNRQNAVKDLIELVDVLLVVGSQTSSNSNRLRDIGEISGKMSYLIDSAEDIRDEWFSNAKSVGITAGASAPELLVSGVIKYFTDKFPETTIDEIDGSDEDIVFLLPKEVRTQ
jgi:4-hydroxy-3-methylbut-2-enyl diphosphate reductase